MKERDELKESRKRIRALEAALADAHMDRCLGDAFLEIACEKLKTTPEEFLKKERPDAVERARTAGAEQGMKFGVGKLCGRVGMSRQNFYKESRQRKRREVDADLVEQLVKAERAVQPRLGGRKLHHLCKKSLEEAGAGLGRDRFFDVLADRDLLLEPLPKRPRTTDSRHCLPVFSNLISGIVNHFPAETLGRRGEVDLDAPPRPVLFPFPLDIEYWTLNIGY